jgi:hypothetical protein
MSRESLPWPTPAINSRTGETEFFPRIGKTTRAFRSMAEARDYEVGVMARRSGCEGLTDDASSATRLGYCDEQKAFDERDASQMTFVQYLAKRQAQARASGRTFDQMLAEVSQ